MSRLHDKFTQAEGPSCQYSQSVTATPAHPTRLAPSSSADSPATPRRLRISGTPRLARASGDLPGAVAAAWGTSTGAEPITFRLRRLRRFGRQPWRTTSRSSRPSSPPATASSSPVPTCRLPFKLQKPNSSPKDLNCAGRDSRVAAGARSG